MGYVILIIILVLFVFLVILDLQLKNPYKLYLVLGNKGTGKSAYFATLFYKYTRKKVTCFSNMDLGEKLPEDYWNHDFPPNSVLFIDEAGLKHDNRSFKTFPKKAVEFYKYQRKNKLIIYLSSQTIDIDKKIRDLTDYHILLRRFLPIVFPIYYHRIFKVEKQMDTGGLEIIDTLTANLIPIKFSDIFILNFIIKKYDTLQKPEKVKE